MADQLNNLENVLNTIQKKYISLPDHEIRRNNEILNRVVSQIENEMKNDPLFFQLFNRKFYGGSFFDGLRVGKPEEFDLDFLLKIPKVGNPELTHTNVPGYLSLRFKSPEALSEDFKRKMLDDKNYLSTTKLLKWIKSVFTKAMNKFRTPYGFEFSDVNYKLMGSLSESGPAMTLKLNGEGIKIDVDVVPCFEFNISDLPNAGYRSNPVPNKNTFFIVPKSPKNINPKERYWRLSFQEQEREIINGKRTLKPTLKIIKRLRDVLQHKQISSYFIKTIFLWEDEKNGASYWNDTMSNTFIKMLDNYIGYIEAGKIPYFWNRRNNLIDISPETLANMKNRLRAIQKDILAKQTTDPMVICRYLQTPITTPEIIEAAQSPTETDENSGCMLL